MLASNDDIPSVAVCNYFSGFDVDTKFNYRCCKDCTTPRSWMYLKLKERLVLLEEPHMLYIQYFSLKEATFTHLELEITPERSSAVKFKL